MKERLAVAPEVASALADGAPVVALESTIIAHGMPYPANVETAARVDALVREGGAVPATVGVCDGRLIVGLSDDEVAALAQAPDVAKVSRRDLAAILARGEGWGATTVAATMIAAHLAGIRVFVTGGIGGVHRGGEASLDVSADLTELARTPVAVVCAGAKAILDLPRTLEVLETQGVPVVGYGTDELPAFYTRDSGVGLTAQVDDPTAAAALMRAHWDLLDGGLVFANPVPVEAAMDRAEVERLIARALDEAATQGIAGNDVTPFLLDRLAALSDGATLKTNIALVEHNARVGAAIAAADAGA